MKARDIVAGWPRGRSTSTLGLTFPDHVGYLRWALGMMGIDFAPYEAEAIERVEYHRAQQRMMDMWHERWRNGFYELIGSRLVGDGEMGYCMGFSFQDIQEVDGWSS